MKKKKKLQFICFFDFKYFFIKDFFFNKNIKKSLIIKEKN